jgi:hypothetical protein
MKHTIDIKSTRAPGHGFSKGSGFVHGKKTLGFFGLKESVSFTVNNKLIRTLISHLSDTRHGGITEDSALVNLYKGCGPGEAQQQKHEQLQNVLGHILDRGFFGRRLYHDRCSR